ncbi:MAG: hypothetical protein ABW007_00275 [Chitinophagaceae bacterium]
MKKLFILSATFLLAVAAVNAQDNTADIAKTKTTIKEAKLEKKEARKQLHAIEGDDVGVMVKDHFYEDFGDIDPRWRRTKFFNEASFMKDGKSTVAYYNSDAELVGTTNPAQFSDLPASAQKTIRKQYKGYETEKVFLFNGNEENPSDMMLYGTTFSADDNYFVELTKADKKIILEVNMDGLVSYFSEITR